MRLRSLIIWVFLAWNLAVPLRYYLGDDPFDERFAWRMFSPTRMVSCEVRLYDAARQPIDLSQQLHVAWINLLKRARLSVLDQVALKLCADQRAQGQEEPALYAHIRCATPQAPRLALCQAGPPRSAAALQASVAASPECAQRPAEVCVQQLCGALSPEACYAQHCLYEPIRPDLNLCLNDRRAP